MNENLREIQTRLDAKRGIYAEALAISNAADTVVREVEKEYFVALLLALQWCFLRVGWCSSSDGSARFAAIIKDDDLDRYSENQRVWAKFLDFSPRLPTWCARLDSAGGHDIEVYVDKLPPEVREHLVSPVTHILIETNAKLAGAQERLARHQREVDQYTELLKRLSG